MLGFDNPFTEEPMVQPKSLARRLLQLRPRERLRISLGTQGRRGRARTPFRTSGLMFADDAMLAASPAGTVGARVRVAMKQMSLCS